MISSNNLRGLLCLLLCLASLPAAALEYQDVTVISRDKSKKVFMVEVARTREEQAQGLMGRKAVAEGTGMLFPLDPPKEASFWMKDTLVPLDMIFVGIDGKILRIAENTEPGSLEQVPAGGITAYVLEIGGGEAKRLGIKAGDILSTETHVMR